MVAHAVELGAALHVVEVFLHLFFLRCCCHLFHVFALRSQNHESYAKHSVGASGEDGKLHVGVFHVKHHLCALGAAYPVALRVGYAVAPLYGVEAIEQTLRIGRRAKAPLAHLLLHHGEAAAY